MIHGYHGWTVPSKAEVYSGSTEDPVRLSGGLYRPRNAVHAGKKDKQLDSTSCRLFECRSQGKRSLGNECGRYKLPGSRDDVEKPSLAVRHSSITCH